jgi:hypothetical protein
MRRSSRHEYAQAIAARYRQALKTEEGRLLSEFCAATATRASTRSGC